MHDYVLFLLVGISFGIHLHKNDYNKFIDFALFSVTYISTIYGIVGIFLYLCSHVRMV